MPYFGNAGFIAPSQSHHYLSFVERIISLALDESFTFGESLDKSKFISRAISEDPFVISELVDPVKILVRNLAEAFNFPEYPGFTEIGFTQVGFNFSQNTLSRVVIKARTLSDSFSLTDAVAIARVKTQALAESFTFGESLDMVRSKARSLAESFTMTDTLTRAMIKLRSFLSVESFTMTDSAAAAKVKSKALAEAFTVGDALTRITSKARALAESFTFGESLARSLLKARAPGFPESFTIGEVLTAIKINGRALAESFTIGETLTRTTSKFRSLTESFTITDAVARIKSIPRALAESFTITDTVTRGRIKIASLTESFSITDLLTKLKPVVRNLAESFTITDSVARIVTTFVRTWILSSHSTDFPSRLDGLVIDYITNKWTETDPLIGGIAPTLQTSNVNIGNYDYDKFRTYYIKVTEGQAAMHNRLRDNLYGFETPIEFECWARRLSKGEAFDQLNNIINELLRILIEYQAEDIFGIQGVLFDSITPLETTGNTSLDSAAKTVWKKALRVRLVYYKINLLRGT